MASSLFISTPANAAPSLPQLNAVAPVDVPAAPMVVDVAGDGLSVMASWLPADPAAAVTSYDVTASPASDGIPDICPSPAPVVLSVDGSATAAFITGLCPQVAYTVTMTATNEVGTSDLSNVSDAVVPLPAQAPREPVFTGSIGRDGEVTVSWAAPAFDGGSPVTGYTVVARAADGTEAAMAAPGPTETNAVLSGLQSGTEYSIELAAVNAAGASPAAVTAATPSADYVPGAPRGLTVLPDAAGAIDVSWNEPADDGGSSITGYTVSWQRAETDADGAWVAVDGAILHSMNVGSAAGTAQATDFEDAAASYLFTVVATNAVGAGEGAVSSSGASPTVDIKADVVVMDEATMAAVVAASDEGLAWSDPAPAAVTALSVGNVIVGAASDVFPGGVLRHIDAIAHQDNRVILTTTEAALDDVFGSMSLSADLDTADSNGGAAGGQALRGSVTEMVPGTDGVQEMRVEESRLGVGVTASLRHAIGIEKKVGPAYFKGQIAVGASISVELGVSPGAVSVEASAAVQADITGEVGLKGSAEWEIGEIKGVTSTFFIGVVPVVVQPKLPVFLTMSGQIVARMSASAKLGGSITWSSDRAGELRGKNLSTPPKATMTPIGGVSLSGKGSIGLKASPVAALYTLTGPSLIVEARVAGELNLTPQPGEKYFEVALEVEVSAGLVFKAFGQYIELSSTIFETSWSVFFIDSPPTATYALTAPQPEVGVGGSIPFTAKRSDGVDTTKTWTVQNGVAGDSVSSTGVFTPAAPAGRTVTIVAGDATGASGSMSIRVGTLFTAPRNLRVSSDMSALALNISWQEPKVTGDAPLYQYVVQTSPSTGTHVLDAGTTSLSITEFAPERPLTPGAYSVTVYAANRIGKVSPSATTKVDLRPLCTVSFTGEYGGSWGDAANWDKGRLPGSGDWVCSSSAVTLPAGVTAKVSGLSMSSLTLDGRLDVSTYFAMSGEMVGSGRFEAGTTVTWELSGNVAIDVVNRGTLSAPGWLTLSDATLTNYGTMNVAGDARITGTSEPDVPTVINKSGARLRVASDENGTPSISSTVLNEGRLESVSGRFSTVMNNGVLVAQADAEETEGSAIEQLDAGSGSLSGPGTLIIDRLTVPAAGKTLPARGGALYELREVTGGTLTLATGTNTHWQWWTWYDNTLAADIVNRGSMTVSDSWRFEASTITNFGTLTLEGHGFVGGTESSALINEAGGRLVVLESAEHGRSSVSIPVINRGTVESTSGWFDDFTNEGTLVVHPGSTNTEIVTLRLASGDISGSGDLYVFDLVVPAAGRSLPARGGARSTLSGVSGGELTLPSGSLTSWVEGRLSTDIVNHGRMEVSGRVDITTPSDEPQRIRNEASGRLVVSATTDGGVPYINVPVLNRGTVEAASAHFTAAFTNTGTVIVNPAAVDYSDTSFDRLDASSGTISGSGMLEIWRLIVPASGATLPARGGAPYGVGQTEGGTLTLASGAVTRWWGSSIAGDVVNRGTMTVEYDTNLANAVVTNFGVMTVQPGAWIRGDDGSRRKIVNETGALLNMAALSLGDRPFLAVPVINRGTIDAASATFYETVTNNGVIQVQPAVADAGETNFAVLELGSGSIAGPGAMAITRTVVPAAGKTLAARSGAEYVLGTVQGGTLTLPAGSVSTWYSTSLSADLINRGNMAVHWYLHLHDAVLTNYGTLSAAGEFSATASGERSVLINEGAGRVSATRNPDGYVPSFDIPIINRGTVESASAAFHRAFANNGTLVLKPDVASEGSSFADLSLLSSSTLRMTVRGSAPKLTPAGTIMAGSVVAAGGTLDLVGASGVSAPTGATARMLESVTGSFARVTSAIPGSWRQLVEGGSILVSNGDPRVASVQAPSTGSQAPRVGVRLTAGAGTWTASDAALTFQWLRNGAAITGATAKTYTPVAADLAAALSVRVTASRAGWLAGIAVSAAATVGAGTIPAAPVPTISGTPAVGKTLTAVSGSWTSGTKLTYQWKRNGINVSGATAATYRLAAADKGAKLTVTVTGALAGYTSASRLSASTAAVAAGTLTIGTPTISGKVAVGQRLSAAPGTWTAGASFTYQWLRDGIAITGATGSAYNVAVADLGKKISVKVTGSLSGYTTASKTSAVTVAVVRGTLTAPVPTIVGTAKVGVKLTATAGSWTSGTKLTYQWLRDGVAISGATASTYTAVAADAGKKISVKVTGSLAGYTTVSKTSAATASVALGTLTAPAPTITGTVKVGSLLSLRAGTWTPSPVTLKYQWYRDGTAITGATATTYKLTTADAGRKLTVRVTGTKSGYGTVVKTSAATGSVIR
ncbi:fibronectin type III domain-containing protein [Microbacterium sp. ZW T5_56]|uniref:fibronectin type III domain-containing protein n=1 Tax=Microbacterium sp. ZW T5_56 TaxID=3378081 RepID=UPI00385437C7